MHMRYILNWNTHTHIHAHFVLKREIYCNNDEILPPQGRGVFCKGTKDPITQRTTTHTHTHARVKGTHVETMLYLYIKLLQKYQRVLVNRTRTEKFCTACSFWMFLNMYIINCFIYGPKEEIHMYTEREKERRKGEGEREREGKGERGEREIEKEK